MTTAPAPAALAHDLAIDAVFVLSVKTFADRIAHVTRELGRYGIAFELIFDFDAAEVDDDTIAKYFLLTGAPPMKKQASLTLACNHGGGAARSLRRLAQPPPRQRQDSHDGQAELHREPSGDSGGAVRLGGFSVEPQALRMH